MLETISLLVIMLFAVVGLLIWLANTGSIAAAYTLGLLTALVLHAVYSLFELARNRAQAHKEQTGFIANAKENLAIMQAMQNIQNKQNSTIMQQLGTTARLPLPPTNGPALLLDDTIFDDLEG